MKAALFLIITLCLLSITQLGHSKIYKWVDKNGDIQFSDQPPQKLQKDQKIEQITVKVNSVKNPSISNNPLNSDNSKQANSSKKVIVYSATWCGVCDYAKNYFKQQNIPYKEYDIEKSSKGRQDFKRLKGRGVPIILVGRKRMDGFDVSKFEKMYH